MVSSRQIMPALVSSLALSASTKDSTVVSGSRGGHLLSDISTVQNAVNSQWALVGENGINMQNMKEVYQGLSPRIAMLGFGIEVPTPKTLSAPQLVSEFSASCPENYSAGNFQAGLVQAIAPHGEQAHIATGAFCQDSELQAHQINLAQALNTTEVHESDAIVIQEFKYDFGGCPIDVQVEISKLKNEGIAVVVAADADNQETVHRPFANCNDVIVVGGTNKNGEYTNVNIKGIDLFAPGGDVVNQLTSISSGGGLAGWQGNPSAASLVTATIGLMKKIYPALTVDLAVKILTNSGKTTAAGTLIIDAAKAVDAAHFAAQVAAIPAPTDKPSHKPHQSPAEFPIGQNPIELPVGQNSATGMSTAATSGLIALAAAVLFV